MTIETIEPFIDEIRTEATGHKHPLSHRPLDASESGFKFIRDDHLSGSRYFEFFNNNWRKPHRFLLYIPLLKAVARWFINIICLNKILRNLEREQEEVNFRLIHKMMILDRRLEKLEFSHGRVESQTKI